MALALIRRRDRHSELFEASAVELDAGWVHVSGRWRRRTGANYAEVDYSKPVTASWPRSSVAEIRWTQGKPS